MPTDRAPDYNDHTDETRPNMPPSGQSPTLEPNEARGAVTQHNVRYVLAIGIGVVVVLFILVYIAFFAGSAPPTVPAP